MFSHRHLSFLSIMRLGCELLNNSHQYQVEAKRNLHCLSKPAQLTFQAPLKGRHRSVEAENKGIWWQQIESVLSGPSSPCAGLTS